MAVPAYRSQLQPASFRGIKFFIRDAEVVFGRRNVLHEYPLRDDPYAEDLGKKAREYTFSAYVIGENVFAQQKQLIAAIEDDGSPGVLVHPTLGIMNVVPKECRTIHNNQEGGIEYFNLTFVQAGLNKMPQASTNTQANSVRVAARSNATLRNSFASNYTTTGFSDALATKARDTLIGSSSSTGGDVTFQENSLYGTLLNTISRGAYSGTATANYSAYKNKLEAFKTDVPTLITDPETLADRIVDVVAGLSDIYPDNPKQIIIAHIQVFNMFGSGLVAIPLTTPALPVAPPTRAQMALNQDQIIDIVSITSLIQMVIAVTKMNFESRQDAINLMAKIEALIEPKLLYLGDYSYDDVFVALNDARVAMVQDIRKRSATLKLIKKIINNRSIPALVLAYKEYQDATQDADIIARNKIRNPLFIPANRDIEVLV